MSMPATGLARQSHPGDPSPDVVESGIEQAAGGTLLGAALLVD